MKIRGSYRTMLPPEALKVYDQFEFELRERISAPKRIKPVEPQNDLSVVNEAKWGTANG